jgi:hypothetical protein
MVARRACAAQEARIGPRIVAEEVSLQAFEDMHVRSKCARRCCRLSQELDRLVEQCSEEFLIHISVKDWVTECS